jgi:hypothetical protein
LKTTRSAEETPFAPVPAYASTESQVKPNSLAPEEKKARAQVPETPEDMDEALVADERAELTPAQMVERKLISLLKGKLLPVSHVRMTDLSRRWSP